MNRISDRRLSVIRNTRQENRHSSRKNGSLRMTVRSLVLASVLAAGSVASAGAAEVPAAAAGAAYAQAYLQVLQQSRDQILAYDWQDDWSQYMSDEQPESVTAHALQPVALTDICADETPELIFVAAKSEYQAELRIYSFTGGKAVQIFTRDVDWLAAGGYRYCLFQEQGSRDLWLYASYGDEIWTVTLESFDLSGAMLSAGYLLFNESGPNEDYTATEYEFRENLTDISEEEYNAKLSAISGKMEHLYQMNYVDDDIMAAKAGTLESEALSYDEAVKLLGGLAGSVPDTGAGSGQKSGSAAEGSRILETVPDSFYFSSGAGAWSTDITLLDDGSFTGSYHDANMGEDTEHYPGGVIYICEFSVHFSNFEKVDDYTWRMYLDTLVCEYADGEDWVSAEGIHFIPSVPYGVDDGEWFTLYLPGHATQGLPDDFMMWARTYMNVWGDSDIPAQLTIYGLYNENNGNTFCAYVEDETDGITGAMAPGGDSSMTSGSQPAGQEGCLIAESSSRILTEADIAGFTPAQVQTAINEIYARHGYRFSTPEILAYFNQFSWYNGVNADMQSVYNSMSDVEKQNVNFLSKYL